MQANTVLLAFVLGIMLYCTYARKHQYDQQSKVQKREDDDDLDIQSKDENLEKDSTHHYQKRKAETDLYDKNKLKTDSKELVQPDDDSNEKFKLVKRQSEEETSDPNTPSTPGPNTPGSPSAPAPDAPPIPVPDLHVDVGKVNIKSQTDSCNGVLLEPTFVLTSATCVYPNHTAEAFENITFTMGKETKPVKKVFRNPYWHQTGERQENFALLQLQQPMPHLNQKYLTSMTWTSYGLEDLGDSYIADPDPTSCNTASNTARRGDVIRHVDNQLITLSCSNKGSFDPGSPIFRLVDNTPVIYGVYFGHCTTGSLDRAISGSCGARISKDVFFDFCRQAKEQNVDLPSCNSELLNRLHTNFPTTVFSQKGYDAITERNHNPKSVVLSYHSSDSKYYQSFVEDMETIQRMKSVNEKFQIAVIDVNTLAVQVKAVPFIEYRTKTSDTYLPYNDPYDFSEFKKFMDAFGKVGAPPSGSTTFLQNLHFDKRSGTPSGSSQAESPFTHLAVKSSSIPQSAGEKFVPQGTTCNAAGGYYLVPDKTCTCLPTHFGNGVTCEELTNALQTNCEYSVNGQTKNFQAIVTEAKESTWCANKKSIEATVKASGPVSGKSMTPDHCADAIVDLVACTFDNNLHILHDSPGNATIKRAQIERRSPVNTKNGDPPPAFLSNFEGDSPPGPITHAPNTHYYTVEGQQGTITPYSVLFDGNRGVPVYVGFKVNNANMKAIDVTKTWLRNRWTKLTKSNARMGSNLIYLKRGLKTEPEAVEEGQLNPNRIHSYAGPSMDLTFNHINAFPQYTDFAKGVWRKYQDKILLYAKDRCSAKDTSAAFYVVSGLSDYELTGKGSSAFLKQATLWPVAYEGAIPKPYDSPSLDDGLAKSIIKPKSVWTIGCCTWQQGGEPGAETVSIWANNKPRGVPKHAIQPDPGTLASRLFPGKPCFQFFPLNPLCNLAENHYTMEP